MQKVRMRKIRRMKAEASRTSIVFLFLLILVLPLPSIAWAQNQQSLNKELSLKYLQMALSQSASASKQELSAYSTYVENALVFWPHNPDALYLKAKILSDQGEYDQAIEYLKQSLNGTVFQSVQKDEVLLMYLDLSISYKRVAEALLLFSSLPPDYRQKKDFLRLRCKALEIQGLNDTLLEQLQSAVRLFPQDDYFNALLIRHSAEHRRRVRNQILHDPRENSYGRLSHQELIASSILEGHLRRLLPLYYDRWGADLFYTVYSLKIHSEPSEAQIRSILAESESIPEQLMQIVYEESSASQYSFLKLFRNFHGAILRDPDGDGIFEVREEYEGGQIRRVEANMNGDPLLEIRLDFENAVPKEVAVRNSLSQEIVIRYRKYPEIQSLRYPTGRETLLALQMTPYSLRYRIDGILSCEAPDAFPLPNIETIPELHRILPQAALVEARESAQYLALYDKDEKRIELLDGESTEMKVELSGGRVEERVKDTDKDGFFEIREFYQDGKLIKITYDGNNNNIPEYIEEYGDTLLRTWDSNEDGIADYQSREELKDFQE